LGRKEEGPVLFDISKKDAYSFFGEFREQKINKLAKSRQ
jgi:hypothetical protein